MRHLTSNVRDDSFSCLTHLYQSRSPGLAHCVTSQDVGSFHHPVLHLLRPSHSSRPFVEDTMVGPGGVARHPVARNPDHHSAHWQLWRRKWEEQRRLGQLLGVREWRDKLETLGWRTAVESWNPLLLPAGSSCLLAWPADATLETCRTKQEST